MPADLILTPETEGDLDETYTWYEAQRPGRGEDFLDRVDACFRAICRFPESHAPIQDSYRRALIRKYPYAVFYEFVAEADVVTIYGVFHTARDPQKWRQRLS